MINKSEKLGITWLLALAFANFSACEVFANNTLSQVDVKKNSTDSLEFTLYTSSPYAENVVVTKKSDNKYVILMPNVNGTTTSKPDFSGVRDVVTDIDVRAINDGANGYTKVTVITNRPVDIKTNTAKNVAPTQGQKEYRALIAQQQAKSVTTTTPSQTGSTVSAFKLPEIQPTKTAAELKTNVAPTTSLTTPVANVAQKATTTQTAKTVPTKTVTNSSTPKAAEKPAVNKLATTQEKSVSKPTKEVANKTIETTKIEQKSIEQPKTTATPVDEQNEVKQAAQQIAQQVAQQTAQQIQPQTTQEVQNEIAETSALTTLLSELKDKFSSIDFKTKITDIKRNFSGRIPENMPVTLALVLIPLICIIALFNLIKGSLQRSQMLKKMLMENMARRQNEIQSYDNIINNENLSWQEKYQQYRELANDAEEIADDNTRYNVIAKPQHIPSDYNEDVQTTNKNNSKELYAKGVILPKKNKTANNLERILQASPSVEKTDIEQDIEDTETREFLMPDVSMEDDKIHKEITKTIKLKAFAEKMVLEETHRNKKVKHRRVQLELPKAEEAPHVNLGYSQLHTSTRTFQGAQLSVSDLIAKSNKLLSIPNPEPKIANDYDMISVDDYLNMVEDDKARVTSPLSEVVANKLSKIKERKLESENITRQPITNPITSLRNETKQDYMDGLIIKSGYNIDNERGFYLVSMDGKSAVIGRIGEEIYVLKKFDRNVNKPLQVRMDNPNVYMVKADDFKSLVEVRKEDMGVLIEL